MTRSLTPYPPVAGAQHVAMFQRRPAMGQHSMERVFRDVRAAMPSDVHITTHVLPYESRGFLNRVRNMIFAWRRRERINHVVGDVHYIAVLLPRKSTVLTIHDLVSVNRVRAVRRFLLKLLWYRWPVWHSKRVTVVSEWTRRELVSLLPRFERKIVVVHNPLSPAFRPLPPPHNEWPVLLQVGTGPNKNLSRVIEAISSLPVHLRIIGRLNDAQRAELARAEVNFSAVSMIDDEEIKTEYARCDIVIFVSTFEGFGLPILEAQATGRPVITSSVASMPEVAGKGALLIDPLDVIAIRRAVCSLIKDKPLYHSLVTLGFENVKRFSATVIAKRYAQIYRSLEA
jgi:glycosyltransferase involved in cell wall biosynthesis